MLTLLASLALLAVGLDGSPPDVKQSYEEAKAKVGRSSEEQVKLALWCESHGLTTQKLHHLTLAVLADPRNAAARGLMGLVAYNGRWLRPEVVVEKLKNDPERLANLAEYEMRRLKTPYTADGQWALGVWADDHGLKEQAKAHLTAVIRLDPQRDLAWKKLGYKKHDGRWVTDAQLAAEKTEADAQKSADRKWKPLLEKYKAMLDHPSKRAEAEAALAEVTDPRAVSLIVRVFEKTESTELQAVQLLGQIESSQSSKALVFLALFGRSAEARRVSVEILRQRDPRDSMGLLVGLIRDPIKYEVKPVGGPGSPGEIFIDGKKAKIRRVYAPPSTPSMVLMPGDNIAFDAYGLPVVVRYGFPQQRNIFLAGGQFTAAEYTGRVAVTGGREKLLESALSSPDNSYAELIARQEEPIRNLTGSARVSAERRAEARRNVVTVIQTHEVIEQPELDIPIGRMIVESQKTALAAQEQLADDVRYIDQANTNLKATNSRVRSILQSIIGQDLGDDREAWNRMWVDQQGYVYRMTSTEPPPTFIENVPLNYQSAPISPSLTFNGAGIGGAVTRASVPPAHSCFAAGTMVRTIDGDRPIETIRAGDLVLVQDTKAGSLGYQAVVTAYHNPPNATLKVRLGGSETIVATGIHRFWKAGHGWTMARDLKAGDLIRTLGGVALVEAIEDDRIQPVFNLEISEGHSFLVGKLGALVHDNSLVEATPEPFDGVPKPAK